MKASAAMAGALVVVCALGVRCHGAGGRDVPADSTKPAVDAAAEASASEAAGPRLWVVLDDPRFAGARALEEDAHHVEAAAALEADAAKTKTSEERCELGYVVGRLRALGGDDVGAAAAFDAVARAASGDGGRACEALVDYARARAAEAWERQGKPDEAIARASAVGADAAIAREAALVKAEALDAKGDRAAAVPIWRDALATNPRGARWVDTAARLVRALLDGPDAKASAREAFALATRLLVEAPTFDATTGATALRARAVALDATLPRELSVDERVARARALSDAGKAKKARAELEQALLAIPKKDHGAACRARTLRAQLVPRSKRGAVADAWGDAIRACAHDEAALPRALYSGGKASVAAARPDEALARFGRIEKDFPKNRLADDARMRSAAIVSDHDVPRAEKMLLELPDAYPDGDMRSEALFRVALGRMARGDWEGAKAPLDRAAVIDAPSRHWAVAGRAAYFRAKCAAKTGDTEDAKRRWVAVIRSEPLAYYMAQAYGRLAAADAPLARATLAAAEAAEPGGAFVTGEHPEMRSPAFLRALALLDVGEVDFARKELYASGATSPRADPELVWLAASLLDRAGAPDAGHAFARGRLSDYLAHYPTGRWRFAWEAAYPKAFEPLVGVAASQEHVPTSLLWAVMREESAFVVDVKSPADAHGLMQLLPKTAQLVARGTGLASDETALHTPRVSIALGAKLLAQLRAAFPDNPSLAIPGYNAGAGAVRAWLAARPDADFDLWVEQIPFDETRNYTKRVLASELAYAMLYAPDTAKEVLELPVRVGSAAR